MQSPQYRVRWIGKEVVRCSGGDFSCEVPCYYDPGRRAFIAVLGDLAVRGGFPSQRTAVEAAQVERALVEALGVRRLFGVAIGRRDVYVQRQQSTASVLTGRPSRDSLRLPLASNVRRHEPPYRMVLRLIVVPRANLGAHLRFTQGASHADRKSVV